MKIFKALSIALAFALVVSCEKPQSEEEKRAQVEKEVQQRLAAERQTDEQQKLAQQQADLDAREKALTEKEAAAARTAIAAGRPTATPRTPMTARKNRNTSDRRSTASYGTFYRKLEPYGAWFETNDYGYVWQPREAERSRNWRPYTDGHWVYSDAGWTWVSEEPHGWATYHYGRWTRLRNVGWVWVPGDEWAPAWVSFRTSDEYVGWAPLPPEAQFDQRTGIHNWADNYYNISPQHYTFVPSNEFGARRVERAIVPTEQNVTIINQTTNVTNITYSNTTIINGGPNYDELRSRGPQPIERYRLERQTEVNGDIGVPVVRGEVLQISAPTIMAVPGMDRPRTVKETITQAVVEDGWAAITDRAAAQRVRTKMNSEATPPPNAPPKTFVKPNAAPVAPAAASNAVPPATTSTASASPVPAASVAATAQPTLTPRATLTPRPLATEAATAAATATAPSSTPIPASTPTPTPRPTATPTPEPSASAATVIETDVALPAVTPAAPSNREPKLGALNQTADQAKPAEVKQRNEMKRVEEQVKREQFRKAKTKAEEEQSIAPLSRDPEAAAPAVHPAAPARAGRPGRAIPPSLAPTTPAETATTVPTPTPTLTPRPTPPPPIVTPPPNQTGTAATPAGPKKGGDAAQPAAAADASVTPTTPAGKGKGKAKRNRPGEASGDEPEPSPSGTAEPE